MRFDRRIAVRIMHEDQLLAAGLHAILTADPEIDVVGALDVDGQVFLQHGAGAGADVIVADYEHGVEHAKRPRGPPIRDDPAEARVLVFTARDSELEICSALQAGLAGYLIQGCKSDEVVCGVKSIARGVRYFCPMVSQRMADSIVHTGLTSRESEVLSLLCDGLSNKMIARQLNLATGTVKAHLRAILPKLGANNRTHAVMLAVQRGLVNRSCAQRSFAPPPPAARGSDPHSLVLHLPRTDRVVQPAFPAVVRRGQWAAVDERSR
jgi:DNA-binding NarL/FixJ family response regulator